MSENRLILSITDPNKSVTDSLELDDCDSNLDHVAIVFSWALKAWTWGETHEAMRVCALAIQQLGEMDGDEETRPLEKAANEWLEQRKKRNTANE